MEIKILHTSDKTNINPAHLIICDDFDNDELRDKVFLENSWYEKLAGITFNEQLNLPQKRVAIKIKNGNRKIYRLFASGNSKGIKQEQIGLTKESLSQLGIDYKESLTNEIKLSEAFKFSFYWNHPDHKSRFSVRLATYYAIFTVFLTVFIEILKKIKF